MERVKKGEKYWCIDRGLGVGAITESGSPFDEQMFEIGNYFVSENEAIRISNSLRAVLNGADVIQMPNEAEIVTERDFRMRDCDIRGDWEVAFQDGFYECYDYLKSKIVK